LNKKFVGSLDAVVYITYGSPESDRQSDYLKTFARQLPVLLILPPAPLNWRTISSTTTAANVTMAAVSAGQSGFVRGFGPSLAQLEGRPVQDVGGMLRSSPGVSSWTNRHHSEDGSVVPTLSEFHHRRITARHQSEITPQLARGIKLESAHPLLHGFDEAPSPRIPLLPAPPLANAPVNAKEQPKDMELLADTAGSQTVVSLLSMPKVRLLRHPPRIEDIIGFLKSIESIHQSSETTQALFEPAAPGYEETMSRNEVDLREQLLSSIKDIVDSNLVESAQISAGIVPAPLEGPAPTPPPAQAPARQLETSQRSLSNSSSTTTKSSLHRHDPIQILIVEDNVS
jgi:hypothetical protein